MASAYVDKDSCYSNEDCVRATPQFFRIGPDGLAEFVPPTEGSAEPGVLHIAAQACPTQAITVVDEQRKPQ